AIPGAIAFVQTGIKGTTALTPRPTSLRSLDPAAIDTVRQAQGQKRKRSLNRAPGCILQCVEAAATGNFADGLVIEARLFSELLASEASQGLRHAFFGQRQVAIIPGMPESIKPQSIAKTAVAGAGLMGTGIALTLLNAGLPVTLVEPRTEALDKAGASIAASLKRDVEKGRITLDTATARFAALECASDLAATASADLIIEAVFEDINVKRQVFAALDAAAKPSAILASNTSTLPLDVIAGFTKRPGQVVGLHFFSPANIMRLVEIVRGAETELQVLATAMEFVKRLGKVGVVAGVCDGFIGNRIFEEYLRQVYQLLEEGALPQQIDTALENWGMAMGPLRTMDLAGQDIGWSIRQRRAAEQPGRPYSKLPDLVCELGRFGQKTGKGFYLYRDGRTAETDPDIDALVIGHSADIGMTRRSISDDEIVSRTVLAMVNEGARILAEGIAYRAVDIDMIYLNGYGFPAERGGPMFYADRLGLQNVLKTIEGYAQGSNGWSWEPAPLLVALAKSKSHFGTADQ
ncbi:MAG: 3-hydroxyacyl-CoA dehydrogenase NAD-binding domain-containing protein, partial [Hyphomicrobium sp.]